MNSKVNGIHADLEEYVVLERVEVDTEGNRRGFKVYGLGRKRREVAEDWATLYGHERSLVMPLQSHKRWEDGSIVRPSEAFEASYALVLDHDDDKEVEVIGIPGSINDAMRWWHDVLLPRCLTRVCKGPYPISIIKTG